MDKKSPDKYLSSLQIMLDILGMITITIPVAAGLHYVFDKIYEIGVVNFIRATFSFDPSVVMLWFAIVTLSYIEYLGFQLSISELFKEPLISTEKQGVSAVSIVGLLAEHKTAQNKRAVIILGVMLILCSLTFVIKAHLISPNVFSLLLIVVMMILARQELIKFRVKRGYYGSTEQEVREIILFILHNSSGNHFTGGRTLSDFVISQESIQRDKDADVPDGVSDLPQKI